MYDASQLTIIRQIMDPFTGVFEDFQSTQPLSEDEEALPPLGDNVWGFLQPLNRSMARIDLTRSVVLFGRSKVEPDDDDDRDYQLVKLASHIIS